LVWVEGALVMHQRPKEHLLRIFDRIASRATRLLPLRKRAGGGNFNILEVAALKAALDSAKYYERNLLTARSLHNDFDLLAHAASIAKRDGLWLEFGVASGRTIRHLAALQSGPLYGFDSFEGLPDAWRTGYPKGKFGGQLPTVPGNVELIQGWFSDTLSAFLSTHTGDVSLLHVDCDLYSSTKTIFDLLEPRLVPGSVIVFDEYWNYPGWQQHEYKAFNEFVTRTGRKYRYDSFVPFDQQVCVVLV
jgi:hypothetical protein